MSAADFIRPAELTRILGGSDVLDGATVVGVDIEELAVRGAVSDLARLRIRYSHPAVSAPRSVVAKTPGSSPQQQAVEQALGFFEREARFFRELADCVPMRVPHAFHAGERHPVLLLEDLELLRSGDQAAGLSVEDAGRVLDDLASLHAMFWESGELDDLKWTVTVGGPEFSGLMGQVARSGAGELPRFGDEVGRATVHAATDVATRFDEVLIRCDEGPRTLIHNDSRADNIFFDTDGHPVHIDWQGVAVGRASQDVAYLLTGSIQPDVLVRNENALLRRYHDGLVAAGVRGYGFDELYEHYRQSVLYAFGPALALLGSLSIQSEAGGRLADALVLRALLHARDLDSFATV